MAKAKDGEIESIYALVGKRLAALRKQRGLTQEALSGRASVSANYLARTEGGYHRANLAKISDIAEALNVSVGSLFSDVPEPSTSKVLPALLAELEALPKDDQRLLLQLAKRLRTPQASPIPYARKRRPGSSKG